MRSKLAEIGVDAIIHGRQVESDHGNYDDRDDNVDDGYDDSDDDSDDDDIFMIMMMIVMILVIIRMIMRSKLTEIGVDAIIHDRQVESDHHGDDDE